MRAALPHGRVSSRRMGIVLVHGAFMPQASHSFRVYAIFGFFMVIVS